MADQPYPMPGDAVRLSRTWDIVPVGSIGHINGMVDERRDEYLVCFESFNPRGPGTFRGPNSKYSTDQRESVSSSGGPLPYIPAGELRPTGIMIDVTFWRWKDSPCAGGGVPYTLSVPLWEWDGH